MLAFRLVSRAWATSALVRTVDYFVHKSNKINLLSSGEIPQDIVFVVEEIPHECYTRRNDTELHAHICVQLKDALCGCKVSVPGLDLDGLPWEVTIDSMSMLQQGPGFVKVRDIYVAGGRGKRNADLFSLRSYEAQECRSLVIRKRKGTCT